MTGTLEVEGDLALGTSTMKGGRFEAVDVSKAACDADHAGQVVLDSVTARLHFCDGVAFLRLRACSALCKKAAEVACGQPVTDDCGEVGVCSGVGSLCAGGATCSAGSCKSVGQSEDLPGKDCKDILAKNPAAQSGAFWIDPLGTGAYSVSCDMVTDGGGWVRLLKNAERYGKTVKTWKALADGSFTELRAHHISGFVACSCSSANQSYPWQACNTGSNGDVYSFELMKNGAYILAQSSWPTLPTGCAVPAKPTDDIVCAKAFSVVRNDDLAATWYEASHNTSTSDNCGTQVIDLWVR